MANLQDDGAPIVQLLLTVSFKEPLGDLTILDLADIVRLFSEELPVFQQLQRAADMSADRHAMIPPPMPFGLPRVSLSSHDGRDRLMFQNDRLSFGWNRTTPLGGSHDYPGLSETLDRLRTYLARLGAWASERQSDIVPAVGEVVYTDAFQLTSGKSLAEIFSALNPEASSPVSTFQYDWEQDWPTERTGYLSGSFAGPALSPEGETVATLETTSRFELSSDWDVLNASFFEARAVMTETFEALVKPSARAKLAK